MVDRTVATFGRLDMAFNNAGIQAPPTDAADEPADLFDRVNAVNLRGVWASMKHELRHMRDQGTGAIVNCSSLGGLVGLPGRAAYHASKHGVIGLTRSAALEYAPRGIRINAICPGTFDTPMVADMIASGELDEATAIANQPIGRLGRADEIAVHRAVAVQPGRQLRRRRRPSRRRRLHRPMIKHPHPSRRKLVVASLVGLDPVRIVRLRTEFAQRHLSPACGECSSHIQPPLRTDSGRGADCQRTGLNHPAVIHDPYSRGSCPGFGNDRISGVTRHHRRHDRPLRWAEHDHRRHHRRRQRHGPQLPVSAPTHRRVRGLQRSREDQLSARRARRRRVRTRLRERRLHLLRAMGQRRLLLQRRRHPVRQRRRPHRQVRRHTRTTRRDRRWRLGLHRQRLNAPVSSLLHRPATGCGATSDSTQTSPRAHLNGNGSRAISPFTEVIVRSRCVLLEHQRSGSCGLVMVLHHPSKAGVDLTGDLDLHDRVKNRVPNPVRGMAAAGQQVEDRTIDGVPDLNPMKATQFAGRSSSDSSSRRRPPNDRLIPEVCVSVTCCCPEDQTRPRTLFHALAGCSRPLTWLFADARGWSLLHLAIVVSEHGGFSCHAMSSPRRASRCARSGLCLGLGRRALGSGPPWAVWMIIAVTLRGPTRNDMPVRPVNCGRSTGSRMVLPPG